MQLTDSTSASATEYCDVTVLGLSPGTPDSKHSRFSPDSVSLSAPFLHQSRRVLLSPGNSALSDPMPADKRPRLPIRIHPPSSWTSLQLIAPTAATGPPSALCSLIVRVRPLLFRHPLPPRSLDLAPARLLQP